ncbi:MAG: hypothetical protein O2857_04130 [Planctomycetota bacterium]|nr:hypothetical protein [Planctomycetota bacterium]
MVSKSLPLLGLCVVATWLGSTASADEPKSVTIGNQRYLVVQDSLSENFNWDLALEAGKGARAVDVLFSQSESGFYRLHWEGDKAQLLRSLKGKQNILAEADLPDLRKPGEHQLTVRVQPGAVSVIVNHRMHLRAYDRSLRGGAVLFGQNETNVKVHRSRVQPLEPIRFADDFMRTEEEQQLGRWTVEGGDWSFISVMAEVRKNKDARIRAGKMPEAQRSANPFAFMAAPGEQALAETGFPFWDDYEFSASVKSDGGVCGLVFHKVSPNDYFLFEWELLTYRRHPALASIIRVTPQGRELLAQRRVLGKTGQWYELKVATVGKRIQAFVDRVPLFDLFDDQAAGGKVGLYSAGDGANYFDDVEVNSPEQLHLDRKEVLAECAGAVEEKWELDEAASDRPGLPGNGVTLSSTRNSNSVYLLQSHGYAAGALLASARNTDNTEMGFVWGYQNEGNHYAFRNSKDMVAIVHVENGKESVLASIPHPVKHDTWNEWALEVAENGESGIYLNDSLVLHAASKSQSGGIGLLARGKASFRELSLGRVIPRNWEKLEENAIFANDPYMQGWASPKWAWVPETIEMAPPPEYSEAAPREEMDYPILVKEDVEKQMRVSEVPKRREYMHKGDFFGRFKINVPVSDGLVLAFGTEAPTEETGYTVKIDAVAKKKEPLPEPGRGEKIVVNPDGILPAEDKDDLVEKTISADSPTAREAVANPTKFDPGYKVQLLKDGEVLEEGLIQSPEETVTQLTVMRDGHYVRLAYGDNSVISHRDSNPLKGRRVKLITMSKNDLAYVDVNRDHVRDYLFKTAPADWSKIGLWEVTNRFACDPRWSHLNGRSQSAAILWHKDRFPGDVTLEFYAGMRMRQGKMKEETALYYPRVGDLNATICAQGEEAATGYNFLLGAWDPLWSESWTRIMRQGESMVETERQLLPRTRIAGGGARLVRVGWDPGGRPIHGAWYYIKVRKIGDEIKYYFDNHLALQFKDETPLTGDRLGIWTYNNSMMVARVKISYENTIPGHDIIDLSKEDVRFTPSPKAGPQFNLTSTSHGGCLYDFENGIEGWSAPNGDESAHISMDNLSQSAKTTNSTTSGGKQSLRLTNALSGGDFGARAPITGINLLKVDELSFDYRLPTEARVNLYFSIKDDPKHRKWSFIHLNGDSTSGELIMRVDDTETIIADGEWHRFSMDLGEHLARIYPGKETLTLDKMVFGNFHEGYLNVGFGGNAAGTTFHLDNFKIRSRSASPVSMAWQPIEGADYVVEVAMEGSKTPAASIKTVASTVNIPNLNPGAWLATAKAFNKEGVAIATSSLPFLKETIESKIESMQPANGAQWGGETIRLLLSENSNRSLGSHLMVNGVQVNTEQAISRNANELHIHLNGLTDSFKEGQAVHCQLDFKADENEGSPGAPRRVPFNWQYTYSIEADKTPPTRVTLTNQPARFDFEWPESSFEHYSVETAAAPDSAQAARGSRSLRLVNMFSGSPFTVPLPVGEFNAGQFPILSFDYKVPTALVRSNFILRNVPGIPSKDETTSGMILSFTDSSSSADAVVPGVVADNTWRHAEVNIYQALSSLSKDPGHDALIVKSMYMQDLGYQGNAPGSTIHLDNFELVPSVSSAHGFKLSWKAADSSGIAGYACSWSHEPAEPDKPINIKTAEHVFKDAPDGDVYLNIRAIDPAGNSGPTAHYRFQVDNQAPEVVETSPRPDKPVAWRLLRMILKETGSGLDFTSMKITLNDKEFGFNPELMRHNKSTGSFEWDWALALGARQVSYDGPVTMKVKVEGLKDFAGNVTEPVGWSWELTPEEDILPPLPPRIAGLSHSILTYKDFAFNSEGCTAYNPYSTLSRIFSEQKGAYCLGISQSSTSGTYGAIVWDKPFNVKEHPILSFEYRAAKGAKVLVSAKVKGEWIQFLQGPDIIADGTWKLTWCDLEKLHKEYIGEGKGTTIEALAITDYYYYTSLAGEVTTLYAQSFYLDGIGIVGRSSVRTPKFDIRAIDETGANGFSFVIDERYDRVVKVSELAKTVTGELDEGFDTPSAAAEGEVGVDLQIDGFTKTTPDDESEGNFKTLETTDRLSRGMHFLHIRSQDGGQNWGTTTHYPYFVK